MPSSLLRFQRAVILLPALLFLPLVTAGCNDSDDPSGPDTSAQVVGPDGGRVVFPNGVTLQVPPGALQAPVTFTATVRDSDASVPDARRVGAIVELGPVGTVLKVPGFVTIPVSGDAGAPLMLTLDGQGRTVGVGSATVTGTQAQGAITRLGPVWISDRGGVVESLRLQLPAHDLQAGNTLTLDVEALNLVGGLIALEGVSFASSDAAIASVDAQGLVTGRRLGTATLTATLRGVTASIEVTVVAGDLAGLELQPGDFELARRDSVRLTLIAKDSLGNEVELPAGLRWSSSNGEVARVTQDGVVSAWRSGSTTVSASVMGVTASATVTVPAPVPTSLRIAPRNPTVGVGETRPLRVQVLDEFGEPIPGSEPGVTWSSLDPSVLTVDATGGITGVALGDARIVVVSAFGSDTVSVRVTAGSPHALEIVRQPAGATPGALFETQPIVRIVDQFGNAVERAGVTVSVGLLQGTGPLTGTTAIETDSRGLATWTDLGLDGAGVHQLVFESSGLEPAIADPFDAGIPFALVFEVSAGDVVTLPFAGTCDLTVNWGDGSATESFSSCTGVSHTFSSPGTVTVGVFGEASAFGQICGWPGVTRLIRVDSWGELGLTHLAAAFYGANELVSVPSTLPEGVTDLSSAFYGATKFNVDLSEWDVSAVTDLSGTFSNAAAFNNGCAPGSPACPMPWDVSNVERMSYLFFATSFNQNVGAWDVSKVTDMSSMFYLAVEFNNGCGAGELTCPMGWGEQTSSVSSMSYMFASAWAFNQDVSTWSVASVTNFEYMFSNAYAFNNGCVAGAPTSCQPLAWDDIGTGAGVTEVYMSSMFMKSVSVSTSSSFNQDISDWDVTKVVAMGDMFYGANVFDQDLSGWCVNGIATQPPGFDTGASAWSGSRPSWGGCGGLTILFDPAVAGSEHVWVCANRTDAKWVCSGAPTSIISGAPTTFRIPLSQLPAAITVKTVQGTFPGAVVGPGVGVTCVQRSGGSRVGTASGALSGDWTGAGQYSAGPPIVYWLNYWYTGCSLDEGVESAVFYAQLGTEPEDAKPAK